MRLRYDPGHPDPAAGPFSAPSRPVRPEPAGADRRRFRRHPLGRPVRLRCIETGRAIAGEGIDASAGGALLRVDHGEGFRVGQALSLGISARRSAALVLTDDLIDARVVRCLSHGESRYVALSFDVPVFLAEAG